MMQLKKLLPVLCLTLGLTACSSVQKVVYRIDVPQGNFLEASAVEQVEKGMTKSQVQYLLGTPALEDPFGNSRWYYVFLQQKAYQKPDQHTFIIDFDKKDRVIEVSLDKPLPEDKKVAVNNMVIESDNIVPEKSWWEFW